MIDEHTLNEQLEKIFQTAKIPGMAVIAAEKGQTIYEKYFGYRDVEKQLPVTANTIFGLASLTKSVAALSIMMLQDNGRLHVTDRVVKWLPELKKWNEFYKQNIRIHHLLTHTAGFAGMNAFHLARRESVEKDPDGQYLLGPFNGDDHVNTVRDLMEAMVKENAAFIANPGEMFNYSNESYALLQEIIERASGETFVQFTKRAIFQPLEMKDTMFTFDDIKDDTEVTEIYAFTQEQPKKVFHSPSWWASASIYSAGALKSSATDVQKYLELYRQNGKVNDKQIISANLIETMKTPHARTPNGIQYGYGLVLGRYHNKTVVGHGGGVKGISSYMLTTDDVTVTVLTNIAEIAAEQVALTVLAAYHNEEVKEVEIKESTIVLTEDQLQKYTGYYRTNERQSVRVTVNGEGLELLLQNGLIAKVKPIGNHQFILPDGKKVSFIMDSADEVKGIFRGMRYIEKRSDNDGNDSK